MPVRTELPETHEEYRLLNFSREGMAYLSNNLMTAVMLIFFFVIFSRIAQVMRTDFEPFEFLSLQGWEFLWIFILAVVMMFVHEGVHWLSFKVIGGANPAFLVKGVSPHTLAANQYFKKWVYILMELMPIALISAIYLLLVTVLPLSWMEMAIYFFAGNVAYGTTDLVAIVDALRAPNSVLIEHLGEKIYFYADKEFVKQRREKNRAALKPKDKNQKKK